MTAVVLRGDAAHIPMPDESVDLVICSPPYFGLRSYTDGGEHYDGQIGSEATPQEWVDALVRCTADWVRCLKPSGSIFVNLGDKYSGAQQQNTGPTVTAHASSISSAEYYRRMHPRNTGIPAKSLCGLPWRYALACIDQLGLILRAEIIWSKPNGLPESVTDRVRRSHEQVFHFTRLPRYYSAVDEIREPQLEPDWKRARPRHESGSKFPGSMTGNINSPSNPLGKLPDSVWSIPSQPLTVPPSLGVDHFAAFPMELPRRIILGWSPPGVCTACGEGRRPVVDQDKRVLSGNFGRYDEAHGADGRTGARKAILSTVTGYSCSCTPFTDLYHLDSYPQMRPAVVLDPFGGTGTTALVASAYGRTGISVDRSADYCRLARWRTTDPGQRAAALQVPKPPPQVDGQLDLWAAAD